MRTVPIPGKILETEVIFGLTFNELITLGALPLVVVLPALFIQQIPTIGVLALIGVVFVGVFVVVVSTPEGQSPIAWAPAALKRRLGPDRYYLRPDESEYDRSVVRSANYGGRDRRGDE